VNQQTWHSERLPFPPVVLGIAGCTGSGKTTLAAALARTLGGIHFHIDTYYRDLAHMPLEERVRQNFDHPSLIESPLLVAHIAALARGESIERPLYDFASYTRVLGPDGVGLTETVRPSAYLMVEGIFALHFTELLPYYSLRIILIHRTNSVSNAGSGATSRSAAAPPKWFATSTSPPFAPQAWPLCAPLPLTLTSPSTAPEHSTGRSSRFWL